MSDFNNSDNPRRRQLIQALSAGLFSCGLPYGNASAFSFFGDKPKKLPKQQSIYRLIGTATVNGTKVTPQSIIRPGDTLETGKNSELVFVVGGQSMILRSETRLEIEAPENSLRSLLISGLRLFTGKLLSVSKDSSMRLSTLTATIGIRGTGWYVEADAEKTYFCTCYGTTDILANKDNEQLTVAASHHDRPVYILGESSSGNSIRNAPFINHTDQELTLIETLVGRTPPFVFPQDDYVAPRRDY